MNCRGTTAALLTLALLTAASPGAVDASDIYKWTDENGIVHFGDRPSGAYVEQVVQISSERTDHAEVQARLKSRAEARARAGQEEGTPSEALTEEEQRAEAKDRAEKCTMYKERLQKFLTSRRLYREEEGERVYLDEEETLAARAEVQEQVVEYCDS